MPGTAAVSGVGSEGPAGGHVDGRLRDVTGSWPRRRGSSLIPQDSGPFGHIAEICFDPFSASSRKGELIQSSFGTATVQRPLACKSRRSRMQSMATSFKQGWARIGSAPALNPASSMTIEAICLMSESCPDATVFALPTSDEWRAPFVVHRLGFYADTRQPEFQVLLAGDTESTVARSPAPVPLGEGVHLAGTFDGNSVRLYVNGEEVARVIRSGSLTRSDQPTVIGARSSTSPGGFFAGTLQEVRLWSVARTQEELKTWSCRPLSDLATPGLVALWGLDDFGLVPSEQQGKLRTAGWTAAELQVLDFAAWYAGQHNQFAPSKLGPQSAYATPIRRVTAMKCNDGLLIFYAPQTRETDRDLAKHPTAREVVVHIETGSCRSLLQQLTANRVKLGRPVVQQDGTVIVETPGDIEVSGSGEHHHADPDIRTVLTPGFRIEGRDAVYTGRRHRAYSPIVKGGGVQTLQFDWLFFDLWMGELSRSSVYENDPRAVLDADLWALKWLTDSGAEPQMLVDDGPGRAVEEVEKIICRFQELLDRPGVDEVTDIQPFLSDERHWILLDASPQMVWPQKRLGSGLKVDFMIRESTGGYVAVEIESPNFPLYTKALNPSKELTHAEQQVRDYCEFIDQNLDYVGREEKLEGITRPRGRVVIGRRRGLSEAAKRKLAGRNADHGRYVVRVYDDLVDQARLAVAAMKRALS